MTLARIEIEQVRPDFWSAEIEAGYPTCRRERVTGADIVAVVSAVGAAYERLMGRPVFTPIVAAEWGMSAEEAAALPVIVPGPIVFTPRPKRASSVERASKDLVAQARAIGIKAKGSWSKARLQRELAKFAGVELPA